MPSTEVIWHASSILAAMYYETDNTEGIVKQPPRSPRSGTIMLNVDRILFPTDNTACSECAFSHAAHLAERFGADLHVVQAVTGREPEFAEHSSHAPQEGGAARRAHGEAMSDPPGVQRTADLRLIQITVPGKTVSSAILDYAKDQDVDLIVMGTHGRHGLDHLINGSVAEQVVRKARCPVLTLRDCEGTVHDSNAQRILVPVDFSDQTQAALAHARALARIYGARVDLLHVVEEAVLTQVYGIELVSDAVNDVTAGTRQALKDMMASGIGTLSGGAVYVVVGEPAQSIARFAEQIDADLIVIPSHGRTGLHRIVMGSVAESVIRTASCPVFTMKSFGKSLLNVPTESAAVARKTGRQPPRPFAASRNTKKGSHHE